MPRLHKRLRKIKIPTIYGASDKKVTRFFIFNRAWIANERIALLAVLLVVGLGVIGYAAFALPLSAPAGYIDYPAKGAVIGGNNQQIAGWAVALSPIDHVDIVVNGVAARSNYGVVARPDVCAIYPQTPNCANAALVGWSFPFTSNGMPNATYSLYAVFYGTGGGVTYSPTQYFSVNNQPPAAYIDTPAQGQVVGTNVGTGSVINVGGWALDSAAYPETAISSVVLSIDGIANIYYPIYGASRPDVCGVYPGRPNCPNVGFNYLLDTAFIPNGTRTMHLTAYDNDIPQRSVTIDRTITINNAGPPVSPTGPGTNPGGGGPITPTQPPGGGPVLPPGFGINPDGYVDHPVAAPKSPNPYKGFMNFDGWAVDAQSNISKINVVVDGRLIGTAKYGQGNPRPDVCQNHAGWFNCKTGDPGNVGWQMAYDSANMANGAHKVHATIYDSEYPQHHYDTPDVNFTTGNIIVKPPTSPTNLPPDIYIDNINDPGSTTTSANGWAIDNITKAESAIKNVTATLNGKLIGTAVYGVNRPDVCTKYPGRAGCTATSSAVGWTITFNTSKLAAGSTNTLQMTATDGSGQTKTATKNFVMPNNCGGSGAQSCQGGSGGGSGGGGRGAPIGKVKPIGEMDKINDATGVHKDNTSGSILITGWAIDGLPDREIHRIDHVEIYVDKVDAAHDKGPAQYGYGYALKVYRWTVCNHLEDMAGGVPGDRHNIPCPNIGWSFYLNTKGKIKDGTHTLFAKVVDEDTPKPRTFTMKQDFIIENNVGGGRVNVETQPIGYIDNPPTYDPQAKSPILARGNYTFSGWALDKDTKISEIQVIIDSLPIGKKLIPSVNKKAVNVSGRANLGTGPARPDVCKNNPGDYLNCPSGKGIGWSYTVDLSKLDLINTAVAHTIEIKVIDSDTPTHHISAPPCFGVQCCQGPNCQTTHIGNNPHGSGPGYNDSVIREFHVDTPPTVIPNIPLGTVDNPKSSAGALSGIVNFNGWGLDSSADPITAISHVTYSFDNQPNPRAASYGVGNPRPDVCAAYPGRPGCIAGQANFAKVGWQFDVNTTQLSDGPHTVHVNIYDSDPTQHALTIDRDFTIDNTPGPGASTNLNPDVLIENVTVNGNTTSASGWALDNTVKAESGITGVSISLDGNVLGTAHYGVSRPAICDPKTGYPGRKGWPNVGWDYSFNSSKIYNGTHLLQATATDDTGLTKTAGKSYVVTNNPAPVTPPPPGPTNPPPPPPSQARSTADRPPDAAVGNNAQIHAVYMTPSDGPDRQLDISGQIDTSIAAAQSFMTRQTGRSLRYDTYNNGANIDVTFVRTSRPSSSYSTSGTSINSLVSADAQVAGLTASNKIYVIYFEGGSLSYCGSSSSPGKYPALYFYGTYPPGLGSPCSSFALASSPSSPGYLDLITLHEIFHALGAVQSCAPHYYSANPYHVSDLSDIMQGAGMFPLAAVATIDPGNDDYYGVNVPGGCLNLSGSSYLK